MNGRVASHRYGATFYYVGLIRFDWARAGCFDPGEINLTRISRTESLKLIQGHLLLGCHLEIGKSHVSTVQLYKYICNFDALIQPH